MCNLSALLCHKVFQALEHRQSNGGTRSGFPRPRAGRDTVLTTLLTTEKLKRTKKAAFPRYCYILGNITRDTQAGREFRPGTIREKAELAVAVNLWQTVCNIPDTENKPGGATARKIQTRSGGDWERRRGKEGKHEQGKTERAGVVNPW